VVCIKAPETASHGDHGVLVLPITSGQLCRPYFPWVVVLLGVETLYLKATGRAVSGFTTVILLELVIGSFLMISLGVIGEYLARIYEEVKGRPRYIVVESTERDTDSARD